MTSHEPERSHIPVSAGGRHQPPLLFAFGLTGLYMLVEAVAGAATESLALMSDAGHTLTDVAGLGMALPAIALAARRQSMRHTFGLYRLEVLAALANAVLLFAVVGYVVYEAIGRFGAPPDVPGVPMLAVATVGLLVNVVSFGLLRAGARESLNVRGAFLEVVSDMIGSVGVIAAGVILLTTGWSYADPIVGAGVGLFILPRAWRLGREALRVLLEAAPATTDVPALKRELDARTRRRFRPRPPRLDDHLRTGGGQRSPAPGTRRRPRRCSVPRHHAAHRPPRHRARDPPGRARRPRGNTRRGLSHQPY